MKINQKREKIQEIEPKVNDTHGKPLQNDKNGAKLVKMTEMRQNRSKTREMKANGPKTTIMEHDDPKVTKTVIMGSKMMMMNQKQAKINKNGTNWANKVNNGPNRVIIDNA